MKDHHQDLGFTVFVLLIGALAMVYGLTSKSTREQITERCDRNGEFTITDNGQEYTYKCELIREQKD